MVSPPFPPLIKHYRLERELGRGGMGLVVEGFDRRDNTRVAVKLLHPYLLHADASFRDRFEREAHIAALLRSPYTVHLLDYGVEGETCFLVMEFVSGSNVAELLGAGPLPPEQALRIAADVARALEEAAARGVVHRDIKPENILLDADGRVKVADFGIARQAFSPGLTMAGGFVGTAAYAAPEQMEGEADVRTDVYALGGTLYAMLAGHPPFHGATVAELMTKQRTSSPPMEPLKRLPDAVTNIIRRCLEKDPLDRYQAPGELAGALERAIFLLRRGGPTGDQPPRVRDAGTGYVAPVPAPRPSQPTPEPLPLTVAAPHPPAGRSPEHRPGQGAGVGPRPPWYRRRPVVFLAFGAVAGVAAAGGIVAALSGAGGGNGTSPTSTATNAPSPSVSAMAAATTAVPTSPTPAGTPAPTRLPSVTPPPGFPSQLQSGARARVINSPSPACPLRLRTEPSDQGSATNTVVRNLCNGDILLIATDMTPGSTFTVSGGFLWWWAVVEGTSDHGWVKETTADEANRFLQAAR